MEAKTQNALLAGRKYDSLFPASVLVDSTVKKGASVSDTVKFIPQVVFKTRWQLERFVGEELKGLSTEQACEKLWHFVKNHIAYEKDKRGYEQIRSPRRLWHDRKGDCDCFTVFISGCLSLLGIPVVHRITKYSTDDFQHIYPIVPLPSGGYITMDCVVSQYDYEEPFSEKKDYPMELQFLDGIDGLGAFNLKSAIQKVGTSITNAADKVGDTLKEGLHVVNKINPATLLLRAGVLAAMKLNMFNVAGRLKWAYLSQEEAIRRGADKPRYDRLRGILTKLEDIFHGAGGEPKNLKEAILTGNGNKDRSVSGLGSVDIHTPLSQILGPEIMRTESLGDFRGMEGLGELGEPVTAAAITAATGAITAIAALLSQIGNLFPNGKAGSADFTDGDSPDGSAGSNVTSTITDMNRLLQEGQSLVQSAGNFIPQQTRDTGQTTIPPSNSQTQVPSGYGPTTYEPVYSPTTYPSNLDHGVDANGNPTEVSFWDKNKKWLKPTLFVGGGLILTVAGVAIYRSTKSKKKGLSGLEATGQDEYVTSREKAEEVALM